MVDYKKELDDFTYIVSHDFNAPLRHIRSFGDLLISSLGDKVSDDEREYMHYMKKSVSKAENMLSALLEYSRLNRDMTTEVFSCGDMINDAQSLVEKKIKETKAQITLSNLPKEIKGDRAQIENAFAHAIDNAVTFHAPDTPPIIQISAKDNGTHWQFTVHDNGIGVEGAQIEQVFKIFKQIDPEATSPTNMGIGLPLIRKTAENHGGTAQISSENTQGVRLSFSFLK